MRALSGRAGGARGGCSWGGASARRWRSRKGAHGSSLATSLATADDHLGATHGLGAGRVHGVAVPVHLWAGSVLGAARGPGLLGRRSQAVKGARRCRVRGNLPAWRVPPLHPFGAHRGVSRLAVLVGVGAGWGGGVAVQETRGRCLPAGAHCTEIGRDSGGAAFFGTPPPVPLLGQREGDPAGVGLCVRWRGFFVPLFQGRGSR